MTEPKAIPLEMCVPRPGVPTWLEGFRAGLEAAARYVEESDDAYLADVLRSLPAPQAPARMVRTVRT